MIAKYKFQNLRYIVLVALLIIMGVFYGYQKTMFLPPYGQHTWRQCDGASFMQTYTFVSLNFFQPRTNNLLNGDGKMCPEFPIVYYIAAISNHLLGYHDWVIRVLHFLCFILGLFALSNITFRITKSEVLSVLMPLIMYSSPMIVFYSNNYLPDVAAVSLSIIGVYYFLRYRDDGSMKNYALVILFFALCGLLKPTALNIFICLGLLWFVEQILRITISKKEIFRKKDWGIFAVVFLIVLLWDGYAIYYNKANNSMYMQAFIKPIWVISDTPVAETLRRLKDSWLKLFIDYPLYYIGLATLVISLIPTKKENLWATFFTVFLLLILSANAILFFHQVYHHEYYLIVFIPLLISSLMFTFMKVADLPTKLQNVVKIVLFVCLATCINMNMQRTNSYLNELQRNFVWDDAAQRYYQLTAELRAKGVTANDRVLCWGDEATSTSLFLLQQRGWTSYYVPTFELAGMKKLQIKYLVTNIDLNPNDQRIAQFKNNLLLSKNGIMVYKIY